MSLPGVDKRMLQKLESMGFPTGHATRALYYSGNSNIENAINWALEHEHESDIDQIPQVPIDITIESGELLNVGEELKMKLKELREQALTKREEEKRMEREQEKERIRRHKQLAEDKHHGEENERQRIAAIQRAEREEEKRARQKIHSQLELDKADRRKLGLPPKSISTVKHTTALIQERNVVKGSGRIFLSMEESLKSCLRSLKKNHKISAVCCEFWRKIVKSSFFCERFCSDDDTEVKQTFETLFKYIANVAKNPDNEKYRKIRLSNPQFQGRVGKFKQGIEFLELCGFHKLEGSEFLSMPRNRVDIHTLNLAGLALNSAISNPFFGMFSV